jgi:hypothetical protein
MSRRPAPTAVAAVAVAAALALPTVARADAPQVNAALLFLQATCSIKDARLEARRSEGRLLLTLRTPQFTRQTNLVHNDVRLFTEESMKKNSEMPPEMGACFDPASNQIISVLLELPANVASIPLAPPPAAAAAPAAQGGGYVPPMISTPAPAAAPTVVQATPGAPTPAASPVRAGELSYAVQGCNVSDQSDAHVVCGVRISNRSGRDHLVLFNRHRTRLLDADGNERKMDDLKLSTQRIEWRDNYTFAGVRVINDTSPLVQITFHNVPPRWRVVKRLDLVVGTDGGEGVSTQTVSASDLTINGR